MQYFKLALPLALISSALANPLLKRDACTSDSCIAAVTGKAALGDVGLRADHCKSFLATTVTPEAITETTTVTGIETDSAWGMLKREQVTVCPNEVPNYASACETAAYSSACSCFGFFADSTTTLEPTTTTKIVYVSATGTCTRGASTKTVTVTVASEYSNSTVLSGVFTSTVFETSSVCATNTGTGKLYTATVVVSGATSTITGSGPAVVSTVTESASVCLTTSGLWSQTSSTSTVTSTITNTASASTCPTTTATTSTVTVSQTISTVTTTESATTCPTTSVTTVTTTETATATTTTSSAATPSTCLSQDQVDYFVAAFTDFLETTNYGSAVGSTQGFNSAGVMSTFTSDFQDYSDSINYMADYPLGQATFNGPEAFIEGQGNQYPVYVTTKTTFVGCNFFTWHYELETFLGNDRLISGINVFEVSDDLSQIKTNYAEFNNAAWLQNIAEYASAQAAAAGATTTSAVATTTTTDSATSTTDAVTTTTTPAGTQQRKRY